MTGTDRRLNGLLLTSALLLSGIPIAGGVLGQAPADTDAGPGCAIPGQDDKCESWVAHAPRGGGCSNCPMALSSDGDRLYLGGGGMIRVFDADSGTTLWTNDSTIYSPQELLLDPGEDIIILLGSAGSDTRDYKLAAFDASDGGPLWTAVFDTDTQDDALAAAISPDGDTVYATGTAGTVAYDVATGDLLWSSQAGSEGYLWNGGGTHILPSPNGDEVYVAVESGPRGDDGEVQAHSVFALNASSGETRWIAEAPNAYPEQLYSASLTPDGQTLILGGGMPVDAGYVVAFDTTEGEVLWDAAMGAVTGSSSVAAYNTAVGPEGQTLFVEANPPYSQGVQGDAYVISFDARTGETNWIHREVGIHNAWLDTLAVSPDGSGVYAAFAANHYYFTSGVRSDLATLALDADTGEKQWRATFNADAMHTSAHAPEQVVVSPDGSHVYASLWSNVGSLTDQAPILAAYETGGPAIGLPSEAGGAGS